MRRRRLKSRSLLTALTMSWQSSNTPSIARLWMLASCRLNICACWNGLMRPFGLSMKTRMPRLPRIAYSAALPVSPEVAPRMFSDLTAPRQLVLEQRAEQLHRDVLEGQRRAVRQGLQRDTRLQWLQRHDGLAAECRRGVSPAAQPAQVVGRNVIDVERQDLERQLGVGQRRASAPASPRRCAGTAPAGTAPRPGPGPPAGCRRSGARWCRPGC